MRIRSLLLAALLLVIAAFLGVSQVSDPSELGREGRVLRILDGDTVILQGSETVRYLNIDTPETGEPFAQEAKLLNLQLVRFRTVRIETDEKERDTYGRLLAYVYVETEDGWVMVNLELVRAGLANLLIIPPNGKYRAAFEEALFDAQIHRRGMWGAIAGALSVTDLENDLVECTNEVVTVLFRVSAVEETRRGIRLDVVGSQYGFHVLIPSESDAAAAFAPLDELIGHTLSVTGVLECDVRYGPWIEADSSAQLRIEDAASTDET